MGPLAKVAAVVATAVLGSTLITAPAAAAASAGPRARATPG